MSRVTWDTLLIIAVVAIVIVFALAMSGSQTSMILSNLSAPV
jgi:hypothetical protein